MKKILFLMLISISSHAQTTILFEDFSGVTIPAVPTGWHASLIPSLLPCAPNGWQTVDTSQWFYSSPVPVVPQHNKYVSVFDWTEPFDSVASLTTSVFSLAGAANPYLSFDYFYLEGNNTVTLSTAEKTWINISTNGVTWTTIDTLHASGFAWASKYVDLSSYSGVATVSLQFVYTDSGRQMYGCALDNIKVFDAAPYDLALIGVTPADGDPAGDYYSPGAATSFSGTVFNHGTSYISSFIAGYQAGSGLPVTMAISGVSVAPFTTYSFTITTPYSIPAVGMFPIKVWAKQTADTNATNDSMTTAVYGITKWPHKNMLFEECTGTWCGYCVRGIVYMDSLWKLYDTSVNIVAVHDQNDPMDSENILTQHYATFVENAARFANPNIYIDRMVTTDPAYAFSELSDLNHNFGLADMSVGLKQTGSSISVTATVTPATDLAGDYRLQLILTEDNVHNTKVSYAQNNDYSYLIGNMPLSGVGYNFQDSAGLVPASSMYYHFVDRYIVPDPLVSPNGVAGSLPPSMTRSMAYRYTFSGVPLSADWVAKNIKATVILINNLNGFVYNSQSVSLSSLAISGTDVNAGSINIFPNPANNEINASFYLDEIQTVFLKVYDMVGRTIYSLPGQQMTAGDKKVTIPTNRFTAGVYNLVVETLAGTTSRRFIIEK